MHDNRALTLLLERLISLPTVTGNREAAKTCLDVIEKQLRSCGYVRRFSHKGFESLYASPRRDWKPAVLLAAHADVVPARAGLFSARKKGTRLEGRGAVDMKFAIACYIRFVKEYASKIKNSRLGILITLDEERGGESGTRAAIQKGLKPDLVFLPDAGAGWCFETGAKGMLHLEVTSNGTGSHGSLPWEGQSPFPNLFEFIAKLHLLFPGEPCKIRNHYHDTVSIGKVTGGNAVNQIPTHATAYVDIRYVTSESGTRVAKRIDKLTAAYPSLRVRKVLDGKPYVNNLSHKAVRLFRQIARSHRVTNISSDFSHGSSDARFFAERNIPTILIAPQGGGYHADDEWIDLKSLSKYYDVFAEWALTMLARGAPH